MYDEYVKKSLKSFLIPLFIMIGIVFGISFILFGIKETLRFMRVYIFISLLTALVVIRVLPTTIFYYSKYKEKAIGIKKS